LRLSCLKMPNQQSNPYLCKIFPSSIHKNWSKRTPIFYFFPFPDYSSSPRPEWLEGGVSACPIISYRCDVYICGFHSKVIPPPSLSSQHA
jgi:hypothetical protein